MRDFTVRCLHTGYVTRVRADTDHVGACEAHKERMAGLGFTFPSRHRYTVREFAQRANVGPPYNVSLPDGDIWEETP